MCFISSKTQLDLITAYASFIHTWHIFSGFHDIPAGNDDEEKQFYFLCPALSKKSSYSTTVLMRMYVYSLIFNHQFKVFFFEAIINNW